MTLAAASVRSDAGGRSRRRRVTDDAAGRFDVRNAADDADGHHGGNADSRRIFFHSLIVCPTPDEATAHVSTTAARIRARLYDRPSHRRGRRDDATHRARAGLLAMRRLSPR